MERIVQAFFFTKLTAFCERVLERHAVRRMVLGFVVVLFAVGNLPWHLDNYDQAKQAYVSYEMVESGAWWYQTTPRGRSASKPPLAGWISAVLYLVGCSWEIAWRLPGFLAACVLLVLLVREGDRLVPEVGGILAGAAFGLNFLTPRLATLVRTDMLLGLWIFLLGWMVYRKIGEKAPWTRKERIWFAIVMAAALMTKGPVVYAFLLPGVVVFRFWGPRNCRRFVWSGWAAWLGPLMLFLIWAGVGLLVDRAFYEDVVVREFLSRFQEGARKDERAQPIWFYFPHLLHKFFPWSALLLVVLGALRAARQWVRIDAKTWWLVAWVLSGLVVMTLIPAKRVDRIFPLIPPLSLLVPAVLHAVWNVQWVRAVAGGSTMLASLVIGGYFLGLIPYSIYVERTPALVHFAESAKARAHVVGIQDVRVGIARDEGLLLYLRQSRFLSREEVLATWNAPGPCALILSDRGAAWFREQVPGVQPQMGSGRLLLKNEKEYLLFLRGEEAPRETMERLRE